MDGSNPGFLKRRYLLNRRLMRQGMAPTPVVALAIAVGVFGAQYKSRMGDDDTLVGVVEKHKTIGLS